MKPLHVRLYSKPDCHLCGEAIALLESLRGDFDFWIEKINIEEDPALKDRLGRQIPIVTIDGGNRVALRVTEDRLRRAFKKALKDATAIQQADTPETPFA
ncbi:MAG TPA: glutaredoxin family protein [Abditibacteriaceae bacterium]|nr:glutaredoxin family protein [Abditibacteriaceae bacterium]